MNIIPLPVLQIYSDIYGIVSVNGTLAGETGKNEHITLPAAYDTSITISFMPLESTNKTYISCARKIKLGKEDIEVLKDDGTIKICCFPGDFFVIRINPPYIKNEVNKLPHILCSRQYHYTNRLYTAMVYFDRTYNFAIEDPNRNVVFACALKHRPKNPKISMRRINDTPFIIVQDEEFVFAVNAQKDIAVNVECACSSVEFSEKNMYVTEHLEGVSITSTYKVESSSLCLDTSKAQARGSSDIAKSFVHAYKHDTLCALSLMDAALKQDISAGDLREFLGDYNNICPYMPAKFSGDSLALEYSMSSSVSYCRIFKFEIENNLVSNITEVTE